MASFLKPATTTIGVSTATPPTIYQAFIATSSAVATWQPLTTSHISNLFLQY